MEAGGVFIFEFFSKSISFVSKSITIACSAFVSIAYSFEENKIKDIKIVRNNFFIK
jgi:hypothetical protein